MLLHVRGETRDDAGVQGLIADNEYKNDVMRGRRETHPLALLDRRALLRCRKAQVHLVPNCGGTAGSEASVAQKCYYVGVEATYKTSVQTWTMLPAARLPRLLPPASRASEQFRRRECGRGS